MGRGSDVAGRCAALALPSMRLPCAHNACKAAVHRLPTTENQSVTPRNSPWLVLSHIRIARE